MIETCTVFYAIKLFSLDNSRSDEFRHPTTNGGYMAIAIYHSPYVYKQHIELNTHTHVIFVSLCFPIELRVDSTVLLYGYCCCCCKCIRAYLFVCYFICFQFFKWVLVVKARKKHVCLSD